ncbi:2-dehydropantoate 2-reductase [Candidatus Poribacteria bacterium]|nr:2-dehydropantoate 2-reductase [Candidatus Poribacteria bacterium]
MKIAIIGPGAMGCLFAGLLTESGHEVWLLDKNPQRAKKLSQTGLYIEGIGGCRIVKLMVTSNLYDITAPRQSRDRPDLVFVWVKAYDTVDAIRMAHPILADHTHVISLQNGLGNLEAIAQIVNPEKIIGGITSHGATLIDIGHIRHAGKGDTIIGRMNKQIDDELHQIADLLSEAGIETKVSSDVEGAIWSKLVINAAINPLTAITRLKNGQLLESDETRRLLDLVAEESEKIVQLAGITLAYPDIKSKVYDVCQATAQNTSSMLQDILRGKRTEIDAINGAIVEKAKDLNIDAPVNEMLTCLVKTLEKEDDYN